MPTNINFPCICGHNYNFHNIAMYDTNRLVCDFLVDRIGHIFSYCECMAYVPDNLKYLESLIHD